MIMLSGKAFPPSFDNTQFQRDFLDKYNIHTNWRVTKYFDQELKKSKDDKDS